MLLSFYYNQATKGLITAQNSLFINSLFILTFPGSLIRNVDMADVFQGPTCVMLLVKNGQVLGLVGKPCHLSRKYVCQYGKKQKRNNHITMQTNYLVAISPVKIRCSLLLYIPFAGSSTNKQRYRIPPADICMQQNRVPFVEPMCVRYNTNGSEIVYKI